MKLAIEKHGIFHAFLVLFFQFQEKGSAASQGVFQPNSALVSVHDFFGDAKAQAEMVFCIPGGVSSVKAVKNIGLIRVGNTRARIPYP